MIDRHVDIGQGRSIHGDKIHWIVNDIGKVDEKIESHKNGHEKVKPEHELL
jgi:hypothetical protein